MPSIRYEQRGRIHISMAKRTFVSPRSKAFELAKTTKYLEGRALSYEKAGDLLFLALQESMLTMHLFKMSPNELTVQALDAWIKAKAK